MELATDGNGTKHNRFLVGDKDPKSIKRKEEEQRRRLHAVLLQMASADQIAATLQRLDDLQSRLDNAFADLEDWRADIESRTARLADGTAIYRRDDGRFVTAEGTIVPDDQLPDDIPEDVVTAQEYQAFLRWAGQLSEIQTRVVDDSRRSLDGGGMTKDEIERIEGLIEKANGILDNPRVASERGLAKPEAKPEQEDVLEFAPAP
ncbi:MAG: hypothetical protein AAGI89_09955 [Pseudomonadota bacterium]